MAEEKETPKTNMKVVKADEQVEQPKGKPEIKQPVSETQGSEAKTPSGDMPTPHDVILREELTEMANRIQARIGGEHRIFSIVNIEGIPTQAISNQTGQIAVGIIEEVKFNILSGQVKREEVKG